MNLNKDSRTVEKCLFEAKKCLKASGAEEYALDSELFMMKAVGFSKIQLFTKNDYVLTEEQYTEFENMVERRKKGEPCQYITGKCFFFDHEFLVNKNVLIPRPDTEILVETVIEYGKKFDFKKMLDIGTGSGCIAISLALEGFDMTACDISEGALETAKKNAMLNGADVNFVHSNVFDSLENEKFDAIVSNPPYIESCVIPTLMREVKDFEPQNALDGGEDGLVFYRRIISEGKAYLNEGGHIFFEIGYNQADAVKKLFEENGYIDVKIIKDLAGLDRVAAGRL
jgi:release factor glutamine methyltransferase